MNLGWYLARLRNMGPAEIAHRLGERLQRRRLRAVAGWRQFASAAPLRALPGLREAMLRPTAAQRAAVEVAAARILAGRFEALGRDWPVRPDDDLFPAGLWRFDPVSGGAWPGPEAYCFDIDVRSAGGLGDIKYVWEINRLQFLVPLAATALLNNDRSAVAAIEAAIESWHAANPPFRGVAWAAGIEVALRAISLALAATLAGEHLDAPTHHRIAEILAASRLWLTTFPSRHSSANNHRVAELAGLFVISLADGRQDGAARRELIDQLLRQILPDGGAAEQSPTYGAFTVELALLCAMLGRAADAPFPADFDRRLGAFVDWVLCIGPGGRTAPIGDDDEGRVLALQGRQGDYPRSVASAVAGYLGIAGPEAIADLRSLVFGEPPMVADAPPGLVTFASSGTSVWSGAVGGRRVHLSFDHGPLGYLAIAAHGHADALALTLSIDGEPVLVDPGTFLYGSGGAWRSWFRGTAAHNTLNIGGSDQSRMAGPFNWAAKATARLEARAERPTTRLTASHDGYRRRFGAIHRRTVEIDGDELAILDRLIGTPQDAEVVFQFAQGLDVERRGASVRVARSGAPLLELLMPPGDLELVRGGHGTAGGWVSPAFGVRVPAWRLAWHGRVDADGVVFRLAPEARAARSSALDTQSAQT